jgi:hypothetical protein
VDQDSQENRTKPMEVSTFLHTVEDM